MKTLRYPRASLRTLACGSLLLTLSLSAQIQKPTVEPDGTIHLHDALIPPSVFLSPDGQAVINRSRPTEGPGAAAQPVTTDMAALRRQMNEGLQANVKHMEDLYPVEVEESTIDGISVAIITPRGGVPEKNKNRILLDVPGGGFRTGIRANGLLISIPIASVGQFKVVSLLYRQAPEFKFPAATEDFTKVYRSVLEKTYKPANVGLVGCSAGGVLVAETTASFQKLGLPRPGVLGIYCAGAGALFGGDSWSFSSSLQGLPPRADSLGYFEGMDLNRADISPVMDLGVLAKFPPTIYLTGTRDIAMSSAAYSYRRMLEVGVPTELLIYDGLGHGWMTNPDYPESRNAYELTAKFYDKHLGR